MLRSAVRFVVLPIIAWRVFLVGGLALTPVTHAADAPAAASPSPAKPKSAAKKKNAEKPAKKVDATALITEVEKGIALIGKGAKEAKLDPKSKAAAPFFASLKTVASNTETLRKQLAAKDPAYFKTLSDTATAVGRLRVTAPRIGIVNKPINDGVKIVLDSFDALRANFGKEAARKKAGGPLTDKEKETFAKLRTQQAELVAKLAPVREKAVKEGNKKLVADLDGLFKQSKAISSAKETLAGFLLALELFDYLSGEYDAYTYYVPVTYRTEWAWVDTSFKQADTYYWEYYDSYSVSDWSYYESADISYQYDYTWDSSISETEVSEYNSYVEESSSEEVSEDTYIEESDYEESLEANEESQDDSWEDTEEDIADDADSADEGDDSAGEGDDSADEGADSAEEGADSAEEGDDSADEGDDSADEGDDSADEGADSADEGDDSADEGDDSADEDADSADEGDDSADEGDDSADEGDDSADEADDSADEGGDDSSDDGGGDDGGGEE